MLFLYKGIDSNYKYKRGIVESESAENVMQKIKDEENVIVIMQLKKIRNNAFMNKVRNNMNTQLQSVENKINNITKKVIVKDKKQTIKPDTKSKTESLATKSPILKGLLNLTSKLNSDIKLPSRRAKQQKIVMDEDMYDNLQNMFKQQGDSVDSDNSTDYDIEIDRNEDLSDNKIKKTERTKKREKTEGKKIDWSLLDTNVDTPEIRANNKIKVKQEEIIMFTRRLHILVSSGVPLLSSLLSLQDTSSKPMAEILSSITHDMQLGNSFSASLAKFPRQFDSTYVALISIGESSGSLIKSLRDVLKIKDQEQKVNKKIKVASVYPSVIAVVLVIFMIGANMFFIPQFQASFAEQDMDLPGFTAFVFGVADYFPYILGIIIAVVAVFLVLKSKIPEVNYLYKRTVDKLKFKIPALKKVVNASYMHSFSSNIALMLDNGIRLSDTLTLTGKTINNIYVKNEIEDISKLMVHGLTFSEAMSEQEHFDDIMINIAMTGEKSGRMIFALEQVSNFYSEELTRQIDSLLELVQPVTMLLIGLLIAPIIIAAYLPVLDMSSGVGLI